MSPASAKLRKSGRILVGVFPQRGKSSSAKAQKVQQAAMTPKLKAHYLSMKEGEEVLVKDTTTHGDRIFDLAETIKPGPDPKVVDLVTANGGFINPYTFVPTPPRDCLSLTEAPADGLGDGAPPSHAYVGADQWTGKIVIKFTTVTPLILPELASGPSVTPKKYTLRLGPDGLPYIHGAAIKGAIRSAFETITASRYGVFGNHDVRLAERSPVTKPQLTPARLSEDGSYFIRCLTYRVPAYPSKTKDINKIKEKVFKALPGADLNSLHGKHVWARVELKKIGARREEIVTKIGLTKADVSDEQLPKSDTKVRQGWLSVTGKSFQNKSCERFFVPQASKQDSLEKQIPLTPQLRNYWEAVLDSFQESQKNNSVPKKAEKLEGAKKSTNNDIVSSRHIREYQELRKLPAGTLVYLGGKEPFTKVFPVIFGREPFSCAPAELLPESLRPAHSLTELSPADRLFGWVPTESGGKSTSVGYRGRLGVRQVKFSGADQHVTLSEITSGGPPVSGVKLAPLSSPKPSQYRFYVASNKHGDCYDENAAAQTPGYTQDRGLRGRKMYRWKRQDAAYWQPKALGYAEESQGSQPPGSVRSDSVDVQAGYPEYELADSQVSPGNPVSGNTPTVDISPTQFNIYDRWVNPGVEFTVELMIHGVPKAELGPLLWLLDQQEEAPLRLGAAKPYGFGVVAARVDFEETKIYATDKLKQRWRSLEPTVACTKENLEGIISDYNRVVDKIALLKGARQDYQNAAREVPQKDPVHYPRVSPTQSRTHYEWFSTNSKNPRASLPSLGKDFQFLPYLGKNGQGGKSCRTSPDADPKADHRSGTQKRDQKSGQRKVNKKRRGE